METCKCAPSNGEKICDDRTCVLSLFRRFPSFTLPIPPLTSTFLAGMFASTISILPASLQVPSSNIAKRNIERFSPRPTNSSSARTALPAPTSSTPNPLLTSNGPFPAYCAPMAFSLPHASSSHDASFAMEISIPFPRTRRRGMYSWSTGRRIWYIRRKTWKFFDAMDQGTGMDADRAIGWMIGPTVPLRGCLCRRLSYYVCV